VLDPAGIFDLKTSPVIVPLGLAAGFWLLNRRARRGKA
jgi:hypothetical protein